MILEPYKASLYRLHLGWMSSGDERFSATLFTARSGTMAIPGPNRAVNIGILYSDGTIVEAEGVDFPRILQEPFWAFGKEIAKAIADGGEVPTLPVQHFQEGKDQIWFIASTDRDAATLALQQGYSSSYDEGATGDWRELAFITRTEIEGLPPLHSVFPSSGLDRGAG